MGKEYSLDNSKRRQVTITTLFISIIISYLLYIPAMKVLESFSLLHCFNESFGYLGIMPNLSAWVIYKLLTYLFDNYIWKQVFFWSGVPDLNGEWEGYLVSSHDNKNAKVINRKMCLKIDQTWVTMSCRSEFDNSSSISKNIFLETDSGYAAVLKFLYTNQSIDVKSGMTKHDGFNVLVLKKDTDNNDVLQGTYFTMRVPLTEGSICLKKKIKGS